MNDSIGIRLSETLIFVASYQGNQRAVSEAFLLSNDTDAVCEYPPMEIMENTAKYGKYFELGFCKPVSPVNVLAI